MSNVKKRARVLTVFAASMMLSLAIAGGASADTAADQAPGALTSPPPVEMNLMSVDPSYKYLSNANVSIQKIGGTTLQLTGATYAYQTVDSLGANYILQRWTGSVWVDVDSSVGQSFNNNSYFGSKTWSTISGYYYRGKTIHWAQEGSTREETTLYTQSILMGN